MLEKISKWWENQRIEIALSKIQRLENNRSFINEFFCGKTAYPVRLKQWEKEMKEAKDNYDKLVNDTR